MMIQWINDLSNLYILFEEYTVTVLTWLIFTAAALLEVGGDSVIRKGLAGNNLVIITVGCLTLGCYGLVVNLVKWDFSKLLGVYVAVFALISILWGRFVFKENIPISTWVGLTVIIAGGLIIQSGQK
jgi:small multidrug resistance family-3 protein